MSYYLKGGVDIEMNSWRRPITINVISTCAAAAAALRDRQTSKQLITVRASTVIVSTTTITPAELARSLVANLFVSCSISCWRQSDLRQT